MSKSGHAYEGGRRGRRARWLGLGLGVVLLGAALGAAGPATAEEPPIPNVYLVPTAGIWRWDDQGIPLAELSEKTGLVWGGRVGYAPLQAITGELVVLTGSNQVVYREKVSDIRLTQIDLSFLVHFQNLVNSPVYPFLTLGAGYSMQSGNLVVDGEDLLDSNNVTFHIGGGIKWDFTRRLSMRFHVRDTFWNDTIKEGPQETQATVDALEISMGFEYRIPLGKPTGPSRLR